MEAKYKGLIKCKECNHSYKGRVERNDIKYRCNNRLRNGKDKCCNDFCVDEESITALIKQQLDVLYMDFNFDLTTIVDRIEVSQNKLEIFYKDLQIHSSYFDRYSQKMHCDTLPN